MMSKWVTKQLAEYAVSATFDQYPVMVVDRAKTFLLDTLGCMIGGLQTPLGMSMARTIRKGGSGGVSTIVGSHLSSSIADAALLNGTTANALDFEETLAGLGHPSGTVISAALAIGESRNISGKEFLDAVLVGYDIGNRIGRSIQPTYERLKKVWCVGTWQTFGAVSAASKCLRLDISQTLNAYGIAGATAPLPNTQKWGWEAAERPIHWVKEPTGWPSWSGVLAALLAEEGFVGNKYILDGDKGFWIMAGSDRCDFDTMTRGLGSQYEVLELSAKPYSCCRWQHAALDCLTEILELNRLNPEAVLSVDIFSFDWVREFEVYGPIDMVDAEFSLPHSVTMILHGLEPGPTWFEPAVLANEEFRDYSRRVHVHYDQYFNDLYHQRGRIGASVVVKLSTGEVLTSSTETPRGDPENPLSQAHIVRKFRSLAEPVIGKCATDDVVDLVQELDREPNLSRLMKLLIPIGNMDPIAEGSRGRLL